ncbi:MAG: DUF2000 domain-containing protein [Tepidisphaeraceae bacterium]|jgi:hypothetical protein
MTIFDSNTETVETTRIVAVVNKNLEPGKAMNAIAHMTLGLANRIGEKGREDLKFLDFVDADGQTHPSVSARSLIVLRGSANEIRTLRQAVRGAKIAFVDFVSNTMTGDTWAEQLQRTATMREADLDYAGIAIFGIKEILQPLTRRFSLWK